MADFYGILSNLSDRVKRGRSKKPAVKPQATESSADTTERGMEAATESATDTTQRGIEAATNSATDTTEGGAETGVSTAGEF